METEHNFEHFCRICTVAHEVGIMIFSDEGEKMMLRDNIVKYLHIEVASGDRLPKTICISCCTRLDSFKNFSEMAQKSQGKLMEYLDFLDEQTDDDKFVKNECFMRDRKINGHKYHIEEDTEVEVRLDPMMFLKCEINDSDSGESYEVIDDNLVLTSDVNAHHRNHNQNGAVIEKKIKRENLSLESKDPALTIQVIKREKRTLKSDNERGSKSLPDLKPIKLTKKSHSDDISDKFYSCPLCPRSFNSNLALQNHTWLHFKNKSNLKINANGRVICPICLKDFSTKTNLKIHMESHLPKSKYTCDICGRIFKSDGNLQRHKECHGDEIYCCKDCGRVYPSNSTLKAHSVTHSDERPHNCPLCKKTFKRNQDLKFHINQHTGARPYRCPYCPKAFASSGNCFSHRKRMHPVEIERDKDKSVNANSAL